MEKGSSLRIGRLLTLWHIKKFPKKLNRFKHVCIWSGQWRAWWRDGGGYTEFIEAAEIFDIQTAFKRTFHCGKRTFHCGKEKKISYYELIFSKEVL